MKLPKLPKKVTAAIKKLFPSSGEKKRGYKELIKLGGQNADWVLQSLSDDADLWQHAYALTARVRDLFKANPLYQKYRELLWANIFGSNGHMLRMKIQETENRVVNTPDEKALLDAHADKVNDIRTWAAELKGRSPTQYRAYKLADFMERGQIVERKATVKIGDPDLFANELVQRGWAEWQKKQYSDIRGTRNYFQQRLLRLIGAVRDGDFFIRLIRDPLGKINRFGFTLQMINGEWCDRFLNATLPNGNVIRMGIEYQMTPWGLGQIEAYYFITRQPNDWQYTSSGGLFGWGQPSAFHQRISATDVIHYARPVDADATRPAPWVACTIPKGRQLDQYELYECIAARENAAKVGFLYSDVNPEGGMSGALIDPKTGMAAAQDAGPGDWVGLPWGVKATQTDPKHPSQNFETFRKGMVRSISAGMPAADYNTLANDLENINFSAGRLGRLDTNEMSMLIQRWDIDVGENPIFEAWLEMALMTGAIPLPLAKFNKFNKPVFQGRRWAQVDEVKAEQASAMRITNNKSSWSEECAIDGKDFPEVIMDKAADLKTMDELGVSPSTTADNQTQQLVSDETGDTGSEMVPTNGTNGNGAKPKKTPDEGKNGHEAFDRITLPITLTPGAKKKRITFDRDKSQRIIGADVEETE